MLFKIDELDVYFPYPNIYPEQYDYMKELKRSLDAKGHCLLEMPTGTGKTVSLLSLITSYQYAYPETGKLIYCTRTVPEMSKCIDELKEVINYRKKMIAKKKQASNVKDESKDESFLAVCLSSRRNMCIHPKVIEQSDRERVDNLCRKMTAPWVRSQRNDHNVESISVCNFYEEYHKTGSDIPITDGIYNLEDIKKVGKDNGWCPYFLIRHVLSYASVVVYNYQYMLDPKVSHLVSKELSRESIVVFDEAHNIDNVCIEALSVNFNSKSLTRASSNIKRLSKEIKNTKNVDQNRLQEEYNRLVEGLTNDGSIDSETANDVLTNPIIPQEVLNGAVPGNIRKAEHFLDILSSIIHYLKTSIKVDRVEKHSPNAFLHNLQDIIQNIDEKTLKFATTRLNSLLHTLQIVDLDDYTPLTLVCDFLSLVSTYKKGFMIIIEPFDSRTPAFKDPILQLACLDASLAIKPCIQRFRSVIITSGTLSPIDLYPKLLDFHPVVSRSLSMSIVRPCICPLVITRGSDQTPLTSQFNARSDDAVIRNYGFLLIELSRIVPDGIVCFFTSYVYMENVIRKWDEQDVLKKILQNKLIFIETKDIVETTLALDNYRRACDSGRGAVFLSVARGKISEGIDFDRHYGRCVVLFGVPFQYTKSHILLARLEYLRTTFQIRESEFLAFDALRQAAQCVGRVIRSKADYGLMIFADKRYNNPSKRSKLPPWITQFLEDRCLNLSTEEAVSVSRQFLKEMAQPVSKSHPAANASLLTLEDINNMTAASAGSAGPSQPAAADSNPAKRKHDQT